MACLTCIGISLDLTISVLVKSYKTQAKNLETQQVFYLLNLLWNNQETDSHVHRTNNQTSQLSDYF